MRASHTPGPSLPPSRQAEYEREEIEWSYIEFVDNQVRERKSVSASVSGLVPMVVGVAVWAVTVQCGMADLHFGGGAGAPAASLPSAPSVAQTPPTHASLPLPAARTCWT